MAFLDKEVFPLQLYYPLDHNLVLSNLIVPMGDGFEQRATKNLLWSTYELSGNPPRPDGLGNNGHPYRGANRFGITIRNMQHVNDIRASSTLKNADKFWKFYQDRNGSAESFWFYNPAENGTIDLTGLDMKGRYLVRFDENLSRNLFIRHLYNASIGLIEVRA